MATVSIAPAEVTSQGEVVVPIDLDPSAPEEAGGQIEAVPSTSHGQTPLTDPACVASGGVKHKEKIKGRTAKKASND